MSNEILHMSFRLPSSHNSASSWTGKDRIHIYNRPFSDKHLLFVNGIHFSGINGSCIHGSLAKTSFGQYLRQWSIEMIFWWFIWIYTNQENIFLWSFWSIPLLKYLLPFVCFFFWMKCEISLKNNHWNQNSFDKTNKIKEHHFIIDTFPFYWNSFQVMDQPITVSPWINSSFPYWRRRYKEKKKERSHQHIRCSLVVGYGKNDKIQVTFMPRPRFNSWHRYLFIRQSLTVRLTSSEVLIILVTILIIIREDSEKTMNYQISIRIEGALDIFFVFVNERWDVDTMEKHDDKDDYEAVSFFTSWKHIDLVCDWI